MSYSIDVANVLFKLNQMEKALEKETKSVLIVEDEMIIALMIEKMVEDLGHRVVAKVPSGEEAVDLALKYSPDLILMDIRLQGEIDGIEAMALIREQIDVQVIYISGNTDNLYKQRVKQTDCLGFLTKPITINDLNTTVNISS